MKLVIFGANGPTGQLLTQQALAEGHTVTAITRHPELFSLLHEHLQVMKGDVFDGAAVDAAVTGQDAVLSTLGVPFSRKPIMVYSQGIAHIIEAMKRHNVRRLICVSSSATNPHDGTQNGFLFEKILQPIITNTIGKTMYDDMRRMETLVMDSDLDWTIVRPSGLFHTPAVTDYQAAEAFVSGTFTSRADLADCILRQVSDKRYLRKPVAVTTSSVKPNLFSFLGKEAFQRRPG
jgi:putative NADH-flavin reductase